MWKDGQIEAPIDMRTIGEVHVDAGVRKPNIAAFGPEGFAVAGPTADEDRTPVLFQDGGRRDAGGEGTRADKHE
jgi:hypothetical protein